MIPIADIRLENIRAEYLQAYPTALRNYLAGGSVVPAGTVNGYNVAIPSSGALSIRDFAGASRMQVVLSNKSSTAVGTTNPQALCRVRPNGDFQLGSKDGNQYTWNSQAGMWGVPQIANEGANFQVKATQVSGTVYGTLNTWEDVSVDRTWYVAVPSYLNSLTGQVKLEIRNKLTGTILATGTMTLTSKYVVDPGGGGL